MQQQSKPKWPNLFVVGAARAGTSSLHRYLSTVNAIYMSPQKEPHFFSYDFVSHLGYEGARSCEEDYLALFKQATGKRYIGESSTSYLPCAATPSKIYEKSPGARIVVSLRDPVERAFSHYLMELRSGSFRGSFKQEIERELRVQTDNKLGRIHLYHYVEKIERYMAAFGTQQVKVLIFEQWIHRPQAALNELLEFLGLPSTPGMKSEYEIYNRYHEKTWLAMLLRKSKVFVRVARDAIPKSWRIEVQKNILTRDTPKPEIDRQAAGLLIDYYREDALKLQDLLRIKLPWRWFLQQ